MKEARKYKYIKTHITALSKKHLITSHHCLLVGIAARLWITSCHPRHRHVLFSLSHSHHCHWRGRKAWHLMVMLCCCLPTTGLWQHFVCGFVCVGFSYYSVCVCVDDLSSPTYSTVIYPPALPSDLVTMPSSREHIVSTPHYTEMLFDMCPVHSCIARVSEEMLSCLLDLKLQTQLCVLWWNYSTI